jgi:hypothetical protein
MNSLDILFWLVAAYVLVLLAERATARRWVCSAWSSGSGC